MKPRGNRCILLTTDEQPEQTRRILTRMARIYSGSAADDLERIRQRHHSVQRTLEPYPVIVPYAGRLAEKIDHDRVEARRGFQCFRLLGLDPDQHVGPRRAPESGRSTSRRLRRRTNRGSRDAGKCRSRP